MFVATVIVAVVLALALAGSAVAKLRKVPAVVETLGAVGVTPERLPQLATLEILGAIGLILGLLWWPLGVAAAIGVILYFAGAVGFHIKAGDLKGMPPAGVLGLLAVAALVLRLASH